MEISQNCIDLISEFEGCRLDAYLCPAGVWTIGYGHITDVTEGQTITKEQAKQMLMSDLKKYSKHVNNYIDDGTISFTLSQNQFDALVSFCYNCGAGNLKKLVSGRSACVIAEKLPAYNKGGGKVLPGLTRRRKSEQALFLNYN